uniref:Uncharacterized protein n=1 Tax=Heterorhabditis bacteriophora TaxID=37862 RepID=A0A1I7XPG4_HETBA
MKRALTIVKQLMDKLNKKKTKGVCKEYRPQLKDPQIELQTKKRTWQSKLTITKNINDTDI